MKALLGSQENWAVVEDGFDEPTNTTGWSNAHLKVLKDARVKDKAALYILYQTVDESSFKKIASAKSSKEVWDILEKAYKGDDRVTQVRLQTLRGKLDSMRMKETEGVAEYITRVETVVNQLARNRETLPASRVVEKILRLLTNDFENVVYALGSPRTYQSSQLKCFQDLLKHTNNEKRRSGSHLINYSKRRCQLKMRKLRTLKVEDDIEEV